MNTRLLLLFLFSPAFVFSQTKITGKVIDKETQKPVSDVIIHSNSRTSITDSDGQFYFGINHSETLYFNHLSYKSFKIQSDSLPNNGMIYLTPSITELGEVVISPGRAEYLLNKAINNLFANFQKEKTTAYYLTHVEEKTTNGGEREVYALLEILLNKINAKKEFFEWDLKLMQLDRIKNTGINDFIAEGKNFSIQFFRDKIRFSTNKTEKDTVDIFRIEVYDENNDYVIIKRYPNKRNHYYSLFTINKQDTVLTEIITQSYSNSNELTTKEVMGSYNVNVYNHFHKSTFSRNNTSGLYYMEQFQHFSHLKMMTETPYEATFTALTHTVENISQEEEGIGKKKRIYTPYSYYLYKSKLPDSPAFWKKYLRP